MTEFRVIDGDGPRSWKFGQAVRKFENLSVELLRSLVRQDPNAAPTVRLFLDFVSLAGECDERPFEIIETALTHLRERLETASKREIDGEDLRVSEAGVRHVTAILASDEFARARTSKASSDLHKQIEGWLLTHERRCRENGHSYFRRLTADADQQARASKELEAWRKGRAAKQEGGAALTELKRRAARRKKPAKGKKPKPPPKDFSL